MDLAIQAARRDALITEPCRDEAGNRGVATGVNIVPGSDDDGWVVPDPVPLSDGSQIQLYKDGEALHAAYNAIAGAKRRICLEVYIFAPDETGNAFAELLAAKAREGVRVFMLYDALGSLGASEPLDRIRKAGGNVQAFHPIWPWELKFGWRVWNRDHRKLLVVDDDIAGLGGLNIGANYAGSWVTRARTALRSMRHSSPTGATGGTVIKGIGDLLGSAAVSRKSDGDKNDIADECEPWRDDAMGIRGPAAKMFLNAFARSWRYVHSGGRIARAEYIENIDCDKGELGVFASAPTVNSPLRPYLLRLIRGARSSIDMTMAYFVPDDGLVAELCKAAKRKVKVRLMLPGLTDIRLVQIAARSFYEKLMSCGVQIYERQHAVLHAKAMCVDGELSIIGSTNLDYRSIEYNCELSAIVRSKTLAGQMHKLFDNDIRYARRMELQQWRCRPYHDRFVQWAVSRARYLL